MKLDIQKELFRGLYLDCLHTRPQIAAFPKACLYLSKNKQNEVVNENSKNLNCEIDVLGRR